MSRKTIAVGIVLMALICIPVVIAATNAFSFTKTTTTELASGATYSGYTIASDKIALAGAEGRYESASFAVPNLTSVSVTSSGFSQTADTLDYGILYSNYVWLNSTDGRHLTGSHAAYMDRWTMTTPVGSTGATVRDTWFPNYEDLTLYNNAVIQAGANTCGNALYLDGDNDYARGSVLEVPIDATWTIAFMTNPQTTGGYEFMAYKSGADTNRISVGTIYSAPYNKRYIFVRDAAGHMVSLKNDTRNTPLSTWHLVIATCNGDTIYLYEDGDLVASGSVNTIDDTAKVDTVIVGCVYSGGAYLNDFKGYVDDVTWMQGYLSPADCALSSDFSQHMINDATSVGNTPESTLTVPSSKSAWDSGTLYLTSYGYGTFDIPDYTYTIANTKPIVRAMWPKDDLEYTGDVVLTVDASDADISYSNIIATDFYVDGVYVDASSRLGNGEIQLNIGPQSVGSHTWYGEVYDAWNGRITSITETFVVPGDLTFKDEITNDVIDDRTVTANFYSADGTTSETKTTADGTMTLDGLPSNDLLIGATASGYYDRKTIVNTVLANDTIYLIDVNQTVVYNTLRLNTQTITYPVTDYWIEVQKGIDGETVTVFSSYFDFSGQCGLYMVADNVYQLVLHTPGGQEFVYGWLYPDVVDNILDISISNEVAMDSMVNNWLSVNVTANDDPANNVVFTWASNESVDLVTMDVYESGSQVADYNSSADSGTLSYVGDSAQHTYHVKINVTTDSGKYYYTEKLFTINEGKISIMPASYPSWLEQSIIIGVTLMIMLMFSAWRTDMGCIAGCMCMGAAKYFELIPMSITVFMLFFLITLAAIIEFKVKKDRSV